MLFFQAVLLLAYLYAHFSIRWLGPRLQVDLCTPAHAPSAASWFCRYSSAPISLPQDLDPTWWLLKTMAATVGPPFFVLATMAPLLQRWFATLPHPSAGDP